MQRALALTEPPIAPPTRPLNHHIRHRLAPFPLPTHCSFGSCNFEIRLSEPPGTEPPLPVSEMASAHLALLGVAVMLCLSPIRGGADAPTFHEQQRVDLRLLEALFGAAKLTNHSAGTIKVDHPLDSGGAASRRISELGQHWADIRGPEDGARLPPVTQVKVRAVHRDLILWLSLRQPTLTHLIRGLKRQLSSRLGLTMHPDQWPTDLNRGLRAQPVHRCAGVDGCDTWHAQAAWPALEMAVQRLEAALGRIAPEAFAMFSPAAQRAYDEPEGLQVQ